jgi:glyceraldehyde 3-phosphate dehydrogenase
MIGINGLGRIGRLALRAAFELPKDVNVIAVNDPFMKPEELRYLLTYDSAHLRFPYKPEKCEDGVIINGKKIKLYTKMNPSEVPWGEHNVSVVLECTGKFLTTESVGHLKGGAKK